MKILIADDDPVSRLLLESTLSKLGQEVVSVADGTTAVARLLEPGAPRLAILDWMMPGLDGLAVCREVRRRPEPYVYVILLTARDQREDMVVALDAQVDDFLTKPLDSVELRARLQSGQRVLELQERLLESQAALRHQATHDHLTGLWNRAMILEELGRTLPRTIDGNQPFAVAIVDLDHFKQINDTHGHTGGDTVLREAAGRLRAILRDYDSIGRYGGEEFLVLLPGCDAAAAADIAERARAAVAAAPVDIDGAPVPVTASIGVASVSTHIEPAVLVDAADAALYRAKDGGRNRVELGDIIAAPHDSHVAAFVRPDRRA